jgi:hypothetical protein
MLKKKTTTTLNSNVKQVSKGLGMKWQGSDFLKGIMKTGTCTTNVIAAQWPKGKRPNCPSTE